MLPIFICEDDEAQRKKMEQVIKNYVMIHDLDMKLVLSTDNPYDVLDYLDSSLIKTGLYFLDVDLGSDISGIGLGAKIRKIDPTGKIIFVTTHGEMVPLTFTYKVEALDFIVKDLPEGIDNRVRDCIKIAYESYINDKNPNRKIYTIKVDGKVMVFEQEDIMFIQSSAIPHMVTLHLDNRQLDFPGSLKEAEALLPEFYRCHKSFLVNPKNVKEIHKLTNEVEMINEELALVSVRKMKGLVNLTSKG
ncbi:MAG: LytTR family DNA-binding domain-containing protein [Turicibacter sp.]|nr:LytTR family DNA-binding domain-containing protein [Turicibacter sp.]